VPSSGSPLSSYTIPLRPILSNLPFTPRSSKWSLSLMFAEQTLDVFLVSPCLHRIILRDLIIEVVLYDGHMVKTPTAVLHRANLSGTQNPPLLYHTEPISQEHKTRHCCATQSICQEHKARQCCPTQNQFFRNTKPTTAVPHRTNL
jgi:hypothetical protein